MIATIKRAVDATSRVAGIIGAGCVAVMMAATVADVGRRYLLGRPIQGVTELNEILVLAAAYLGMGYAQSRGGHVRMEMLLGRLPPGPRRAGELLALAVGFTVFAFVAYASGLEAVRSYQIGEYRFGSLRWPLWPSRSLVPLGSALLCVQCVVDFARAGIGHRGEPWTG